MADDPLVEILAALEHERWSHWMRYLFTQGTLHADGSFTIPAAKVERWCWQSETPYASLPEDMRRSDRDEVHKTLALLKQSVRDPDALSVALTR